MNKLLMALLATIFWALPGPAQSTFYSGSITGSTTTIGNITYYNLYDSRSGNPITGTSLQLGDFTYQYISNGGSYLSGTTTRLGDFTFYSLNENGTSYGGRSTHIGDFTFHQLNGSDGSQLSGTSLQLGDFTFSNFDYHPPVIDPDTVLGLYDSDPE